ncbi:MAG: deaminase [Chloroflexi bacterium]|nr:MAG: deaminase [Chloroflexota bacterium]
MAKLIYSAITSVDGYVSDSRGNFDWAAPDEEVHRFVNAQERPIGTYLYGRRMYETMVFWETAMDAPDQPAFVREYAEIWQAADKVVYSSTLQAVASARTRIERSFDPQAIRKLKATSARDISIGGPHLAAEAIRSGLVDEYRQLMVPVIVGGGNRWLPDGVRVDLELVDERRFDGGVVASRYRRRDS